MPPISGRRHLGTDLRIRSAVLSLLKCRFGDHRVSLDLYFNLRSLFKPNFLPIGVGEAVWDPNLAI